MVFHICFLNLNINFLQSKKLSEYLVYQGNSKKQFNIKKDLPMLFQAGKSFLQYSVTYLRKRCICTNSL
jgi:hypothetical protein